MFPFFQIQWDALSNGRYVCCIWQCVEATEEAWRRTKASKVLSSQVARGAYEDLENSPNKTRALIG